MRIPASKVYRAFPELDKFSDAQCESFVKAAARQSGRRAIRVFLQLLVAGLVLVGVCGALMVLGERWKAANEVLWRRDDFYLAWAAMTMLVSFLATGLAFLVAKDVLLRRAIRRVMQERGTCTNCGYGLTGLPVNPSGVVICPECGTTFAADESFGEIVADQSGERRFIPSPDAAPHVRRWLTPQQRRRLLWWLFGAPVGFVLLVALLWGLYELFLFRQASIAKADRVTAQQAEEFVRDSQKGIAADEGNGWEVLEAAIKEMNSIEHPLRAASGPNVSMNPWTLEFELVLGPLPAGATMSPAEVTQNRAFAVQLLDAWRQAGLLAQLDRISKYRLASRPIVPTQGPLIYSLYQDWWTKRRLLSINAARMKLATDAGDHGEFLAAFECNLALSRMIGSQLSLWDRLASGQGDVLTLARLQEHAAKYPGQPWALEALRCVERQAISVSASRAFEGEKVLAGDTLASIFSEASNVRFGMWSLNPTPMFGINAVSWRSRTLGTYSQNRLELESRLEEYVQAVAKEPFERTAPAATWTPGKYFLTDLLTPVIAGSLSGIDRQSAQRRGMLLLAAVESYRADRSRYPATLEELAPSYIAALPPDPWTGKPFRYVLAPDALDYTLYAIGENQIDDGGVSDSVPGPIPWYFGSQPTADGDVVIHAPAAAPSPDGER